MVSEPVELTCDHCGHRFTPETTVRWCPKCARRIFTSEKERKNPSHQHHLYVCHGGRGAFRAGLPLFRTHRGAHHVHGAAVLIFCFKDNRNPPF